MTVGYYLDEEHDILTVCSHTAEAYLDSKTGERLTLGERDVRLTDFFVTLQGDGVVLLGEMLEGHLTVYPEERL